MPFRNLPVRPRLQDIEREVLELAEGLRDGTTEHLALWAEFAPTVGADVDPSGARALLARAYRAESWERLRDAVELVDAIWEDDADRVRAVMERAPELLHEDVLIRTDSNWGPPMSYAANLGRDRIIRMLHEMGARDHEHALGRALLQGKVATARMIHEWLGRPAPPDGALGGPAYTLSVAGTAVALEFGAPVVDETGSRLAPVDVVLETDSRNPEAKHAILEWYGKYGLSYPDTAPMALHRGRLDLLEECLRRDPDLLNRRFSHREIYPSEMGCGDPIDATVGTPLDGTTLLHMAIEFDEFDIVRWLLDRGADVNARARIGPSGFGGYPPLFSAVVSQPNFWMNYRGRGPFVAPMTRLLLDHGADPNIRGSVWKRLHPGHGDPARVEYRDVTALSYGRRFHAPIFVSQPALRLIEDAGGVE